MAASVALDARHLAMSERRFFLAMSVTLLVTVLVGFSRSFYLRPLFPDWPAADEAVIFLHGGVFTAWFVLLVVQATLVSRGRIAQHRLLGAAGAVLACVMVVFGLVAAWVGARRATGFVGIPVPPLQFMIIPIGDMLLFAPLVAIAISHRARPQVHKRAMLVASIALLTAPLSRWPMLHGAGVLVYFATTDAFLLPLVLWDLRSAGRLQPMTLWGGMALIVSQPLRLVLSGTPAWIALARWLVTIGT